MSLWAKSLLTTILLLCCSVLTGCFGWSSDDTALTTFGEDTKFEIQIPEWFDPINPSSVENKQITNKILASYKQKESEWFADNIVITFSDIWPDLDYEQFWSVNSKKLQTSLVGYTPGDQQRLTLDCDTDDTEISALFVTFDLKNSFSQEKETTYMSQLQWVYDDKWYIASFASSSSKARDRSEKRLKKIECVD